NEKHDLGADPIGGGAFLDFPKIFTQELILKLADKSPDFIRRVVEAEVAGVEGKLRNIVVLPDGDLEQIDIGMHDWRPEGKFKPATRLVNDLMFAVVKEVLLAANERLGPNGIPTEEIESAPIIPEDKSKSITREAIIRKIAKPLVRDLSAPAFDRYDEKKESFETEARYNFHERMSHRLRRALGWR
ncbi:hypothetical protein HN709_04405, partial [Candidatus Peregrinibacteria bacterium]|nr:hypothetical protein [Candidatus Peregrinibacteria bacterium]